MSHNPSTPTTNERAQMAAQPAQASLNQLLERVQEGVVLLPEETQTELLHSMQKGKKSVWKGREADERALEKADADELLNDLSS